MIELAKFGGASCRVCSGAISRATFRYIDHAPPAFPGARAKQEHYHIACALQVVPLRLAKELASFEGKIPNRPVVDRVLDLWAEVLADPDDDGARFVLADVLQSVGDPRGELIAAQLLEPEDVPLDDDDEMPEIDSAPTVADARIAALIAAHDERWIGRHRDVALAAQFSRGLLARLELSDLRLRTYEADPGLATVEELIPGTASSTRYKAYVLAMTGLRRIEVWDEDSLEAFESTGCRIVHVACGYPTLGRGEGLAELGARFLRACGRQAALRSLAVHANAFEAITRSGLLARLTALTLAGRLRDTLPIWHTLPKTLTVTLTGEAKLASLVEPGFGELVLRHTPTGVTARVSGQWLRDGLVATLPAVVTRLEIEGAPDDLAGALWDSARARSIEVAFVKAPPTSGIWRRP